ncbi:CaiB/BaiF CoA transferase family protein [Microbacterium sp. UBA1097]|nr:MULTISPECIES: CoA transferase [unclassified Microbacterium]
MRPLAGVRVLALENFVAGPTATMFLADWGADVVKIEPPTGDTYRSFPPIKSTESAVSSVWFSRLNRGKRSVVLELATGAGRERFLELASVADVLVQNLRPGTLAKLGLDYETLSAVNPRLILVSISGFGQPDVQAGPYTKMPAFDLIGQAMSGIAYTSGREGDPPSPVGFPLIDTSVGDWAVTATLLALYQRERTGLGQHLDVAMFDVGIHLNEYAVGAYGWHGVAPLRGRLPSSAPFELVRASEGYVAIAVSGEAIFARFAEVIGHPELATDPRYANGTLRASAMDDHLLPLIERWTGERSVSEIVAALGAAGVPASPVQGVADLFEDEHVAARDMIVRVPDEVLGEVRVAGNPVKGTRLPPLEPRSSPQLGADTDDVLAEWLGSTRNDPDERETT